MDKIAESLKIMEATTKTLGKGNDHYETQIQVSLIPGAEEAVNLLAQQFNTDPAIIYLGLRMGVYLTIRVQENRRLENLLGDLK